MTDLRACDDSNDHMDWYELVVQMRAKHELEQMTWPVPQGHRYAKRQAFYEHLTTETLLDTLRHFSRPKLGTIFRMFLRRVWSGVSADEEINMMLREFIGRGLDCQGLAWMMAEYDR